MSPKKFTTPTLVAFFILTTNVAAQTCSTYCNDYAENLENCASQYGTSVQGSGDDITGQAVDCVCVGTGSTVAFSEIVQCYECNLLTGDALTLTEAWIITCTTAAEETEQDAVSCWNTQLLQGLTGPPCYQVSSSSSIGGPSAAPTSVVDSATAFPTSSTAGFEESTGTQVLGGAPTSTDTTFGSGETSSESGFGSAPTSSNLLSNTLAEPTATTVHSSSLVTSTKHSSAPVLSSSNPAFSQASTPGVESSVQPQPTEPTIPNTIPSPTPTKASLGDRVQVSGLALVIGVLALLVLL